MRTQDLYVVVYRLPRADASYILDDQVFPDANSAYSALLDCRLVDPYGDYVMLTLEEYLYDLNSL